ncbi:hypothetical protein PDE_05680 [Penicillium oxalicum 114-2]|uniref:F-box domain-containing protein n=1 Tax=Penicillium oxalicum (strain 114-2 / CGMCC 5302) TaxID=933388 RepID=S8AWQ3_PENO1|nr:hypothetical protein PDE_05680 [Penicillium oxalicum 114-2]
MASVESHPVITLNPSRPTFLDLPLEIRRRIYTLSGLVRNCPLYLQVWTSSQRKWAIKAASCYDDKIPCACLQNSHLPGLDCDCFLSDHGYESPPVQIFRTSQKVAQEAIELFYSSNRFQISCVFPWALKSLRQIGTDNLKYITSLRLSFHTLCLVGDDPWRHVGGCCMHVEAPATRTRPHYDDIILSRCREIFSFLNTVVREDTLKFSLKCNFDTIRMVAPTTDLIRKLPVMKEAAVRITGLCPWLEMGLDPYNLAQDLANHLTDRRRLTQQPSAPPPEGFRYLDLPQEFQLVVMERTALIAPSKLSWDLFTRFIANTRQAHLYRCATCEALRLAEHLQPWYHTTLHEQATELFYRKNHFVILNMLHLLEQRAVLHRLQLTLICHVPHDSSFWLDPGQKDPSETFTRQNLLANFVIDLRQMRENGLKDLFIVLMKADRYGALELSSDLSSEAWLEKSIMGPEYDSMTRGKQVLRADHTTSQFDDDNPWSGT